jgi:hypothetical protein
MREKRSADRRPLGAAGVGVRARGMRADPGEGPAEAGWNAQQVAHAYRQKWPEFLKAVEGLRLHPDVTFHDDDVCLSRSTDMVLASNSLQYDEDWQVRLRAAGQATGGWLLAAGC